MTKNSAFRALVIDDEPLAREELCQLLNETNEAVSYTHLTLPTTPYV